jgi:hypothetical protein
VIFSHDDRKVAMGVFDEEIAWCKERRAAAIGDLREFCTGARQFRNKLDITAKLETRASEEVMHGVCSADAQLYLGPGDELNAG